MLQALKIYGNLSLKWYYDQIFTPWFFECFTYNSMKIEKLNQMTILPPRILPAFPQYPTLHLGWPAPYLFYNLVEKQTRMQGYQ